jgi:hypothetical protein
VFDLDELSEEQRQMLLDYLKEEGSQNPATMPRIEELLRK